MQSSKRFYLNKLILIGVLALIFGFVILLTKFDTIVNFLAENVSKTIIMVSAKLSALVPFSIFEMLIAAAVVFGVYAVVKIIIYLAKRKWKRLFVIVSRIVTIVLVVLIVYNISAGFMYYRPSVYFDTPIVSHEKAVMDEAATYYIDELNRLATTLKRDDNGTVICPYTFDELCDKLAGEYERLNGGYFFEYTPKVKRIIFSGIMSGLGISGVFFAPTGEPNVNTVIENTYDMPHTIAHELAHGKGVMREDEANMVAYYLLLTSQDDYLRYCGLMVIESYLYNIISLNKDYADITHNRPTVILNEKSDYYAIWRNYTNPFEQIFDKIHNLYLKLNGQLKGTGSYNDYGGSQAVDPPPPDNPDEPPPPPIFEKFYSTTEKMIATIYTNFVK